MPYEIFKKGFKVKKLALTLMCILTLFGCSSTPGSQPQNLSKSDKTSRTPISKNNPPEAAVTSAQRSEPKQAYEAPPEKAKPALSLVETFLKDKEDKVSGAYRRMFISKDFMQKNGIDSSEAVINRHSLLDFAYAGSSGNFVDVRICNSCDQTESRWGGTHQYYRFKVAEEAGHFVLVPRNRSSKTWIDPWQQILVGSPEPHQISGAQSPDREAFASKFMMTQLETTVNVVPEEKQLGYISDAFFEQWEIDPADVQMNSFSSIDEFKILKSAGEFVDVELISDNLRKKPEQLVVRLKVVGENGAYALQPFSAEGSNGKYISYWWTSMRGAY
jgi:hypothetical protein